MNDAMAVLDSTYPPDHARSKGLLLTKQPPYEPTGYRMINSAIIKNFRCLESVSLPNCRSINLIVGTNASGKTALLESLFLTLGPSAEIATRFRIWRGYEAQMTGPLAMIDDAMWSGLFTRLEKTKHIEVDLRGTNGHTRKLEISYGTSEPVVPVQPFNLLTVTQFPGGASATGSSAVLFKWTRSNGTEFEVRPQLTQIGYQFAGTDTTPLPTTYFASSNPFPNQETVNRFSGLSRRRESYKVVNAVKELFPFITDLDIQTHAGITVLHADVPWMPEKVPLSGISSGVSKFATVLLAIAEAPKAVIFIDEVENGFYYDILKGVWTAVREMCYDGDVQIFASTHSDECVKALASACEKTPDAVSLIRTRLAGDGHTEVQQFVGAGALTAMKRGEVR